MQWIFQQLHVQTINQINQLKECAHFNPLKFNSSNYYTLQYRPKLPFLISDNRALSPERHNAQMMEIKNGRLGLYGTEHSKCTITMWWHWALKG